MVLRKNREDTHAYQGGIRNALKQVCQEKRYGGLEEHEREGTGEGHGDG